MICQVRVKILRLTPFLQASGLKTELQSTRDKLSEMAVALEEAQEEAANVSVSLRKMSEADAGSKNRMLRDVGVNTEGSVEVLDTPDMPAPAPPPMPLEGGGPPPPPPPCVTRVCIGG
jgi:hypothetical protein